MTYNTFKKTYLIFLIFFAGALLVVGTSNALAESSGSKINVPFKFANGMKKYQEMCSVCHGDALQGTKAGPPLLHPFYKPSHHADVTFYRAALKGVQAHHWEFGDMPPVPGATKEILDAIVPFVRWYQQEKGLY